MQGDRESMWNTALWRQFGAAIDLLEKALFACPEALWTRRIWPTPPPSEFPPQFAEFWYVSYHALVWLDLYLAGVPEEDFAPPSPFAQGVIDSLEALPEQPYTKAELHAYLVSLRGTCYTTLSALSDEQARRPVEYAWSGGEAISYAELLIYTLRHVQEHAAQLCLFLGQQGIPSAALDSVPRGRENPDQYAAREN